METADQAYLDCVRDILEHPVFQSMDEYIQHGNTTCKEHCMRVSYLSYRICVRFGLDGVSAARAGLLHDLFLYDWHTYGKETGHRFHGFTHPRAALLNARKYFKLNAREENAILRHMWPLTPIPPATAAGFAVTAADKICSLEETLGNFRLWLAFCRLRPAHGVHNIRS